MRRVAAVFSLVCAIALPGFCADGPAVNASGVVTAAGAATAAGIAPGALVSIFGTNLAGGIALSDTVPLSTTLGNVSVTINGIAAPIQSVSPTQINIQAPWSVPVTDANTPAQLIVTSGGTASAAVAVPVAPVAPAVYAFGGQAIAFNTDGSLAAPANAIPGFSTRAAKVGNTLVIFATGLGAVDTPEADGAPSADQTRNTLATPTVLIGGVAAQVTFSGLSPQFVGVNQVNVTIAPGTPTGNAVQLQLQIGGVNSNLATVAISQ